MNKVDDISKTQLLDLMKTEIEQEDWYVKRARPTFLYLMYLVITCCLAGSVLSVWWPVEAAQAAITFGKFFNAIPDSLYLLFGGCFGMYTGARSFDKWQKNGS